MFAADYETLGNEQPSDNFCAETTNTVTSALKSWREGAPQVIESMDSAFTIEELTFALKSIPMWKAGDHDNLKSELLRKGGPALHSAILKFINRGWEKEVIPFLLDPAAALGCHPPWCTKLQQLGSCYRV